MQVLAAFLLFEKAKGPESRWAPYLAQLPKSYTSFLSWTARDIAALQVSSSCPFHSRWRFRDLALACGMMIASCFLMKPCKLPPRSPTKPHSVEDLARC